MKTILPLHLSPIYEMPAALHPGEARFVLGGLGALAIAAGAVACWQKRRGASVALAAFLVLLLPFLGGVQNGPQLSADRYTYFAAPAIAMLIGAAFMEGCRHSQTVTRSAAIAVLLAASVLSWRQQGAWRDSMSLWTHAVREQPQSGLAHNGYAIALETAGRLDSARAHYQSAAGFDPDDPQIWNNLGAFLLRGGDAQGARDALQRAVLLRPQYPDAHINLGSAFVSAGEITAGIEEFKTALGLDARSGAAEFNWGNALFREARYSEALLHYDRALELAPGNDAVIRNLAVARTRLPKDSVR
jgi:Tfp pilus assembly protein PilF